MAKIKGWKRISNSKKLRLSWDSNVRESHDEIQKGDRWINHKGTILVISEDYRHISNVFVVVEGRPSTVLAGISTKKEAMKVAIRYMRMTPNG